MISPKSVHDQYRNLSVTTVTGELVLGIDVHQYRSNVDKLPADQNCIRAITEYNRFTQPLNSEGDRTATGYEVSFEVPRQSWSKSFRFPREACALIVNMESPIATTETIVESVDRSDLEECFYGKGSPGAIRQLLRVAQAIGKIGEPLQAKMNDFVDKYIGVDCSGFVTHYLNANGKTIDAMEAHSVYFYRAHAKQHRRDAIAGIAAGDVMAFADDNHVAAINDVLRVAPIRACTTSRGATTIGPLKPQEIPPVLEVVESCGARLENGDAGTDGLNCTLYDVLSRNANGSFQVKRRQLDGGEYRVWIAPPGGF